MAQGELQIKWEYYRRCLLDGFFWYVMIGAFCEWGEAHSMFVMAALQIVACSRK